MAAPIPAGISLSTALRAFRPPADAPMTMMSCPVMLAQPCRTLPSASRATGGGSARGLRANAPNRGAWEAPTLPTGPRPPACRKCCRSSNYNRRGALDAARRLAKKETSWSVYGCRKGADGDNGETLSTSVRGLHESLIHPRYVARMRRVPEGAPARRAWAAQRRRHAARQCGSSTPSSLEVRQRANGVGGTVRRARR